MAYVQYVPKTWDSTDVVTATPLNHIETGIENANDYAREIYKPSVLFTITPDANDTYSSLVDKVYTQLSALPDSVVADGYCVLDGLMYRLSRISNSNYTFTSTYTQTTGNLRQLIATISSSGSKFERYTTATNGTITYADLSSDTVSAIAYFYGRS